MGEPVRTHGDYTVGWICALEVELAAARALLDEEHPRLPSVTGDSNTYRFGSINGHNVVIVCLPDGETGNNPAATVTTRMPIIFPSLRFFLMVGIGGGVPSLPYMDIRLGDVVVSSAIGEHGGAVQYDRGKTVQGGHLARTGLLNRPPEVLRQAISQLRATYRLKRSRLADYLMQMSEYEDFVSPAATRGERDVLFNRDYEHQGGFDYPLCELCDATEIIQRSQRHSNPVIHYGLIASGNQVMRNGGERDRISKELGDVLCFEMEAAGLMNTFPCLVIRGICDYSDSHKNKNWQPYAAAVAAAYTKELLDEIQPATQNQTQIATEVSSEKLPGKTLSARPDQMQTDTKVFTEEILSESEPVKLSQTRGAMITELRLKNLWSVSQHRLEGLSRWVQAVTFSHNGLVFASALYDKTVQLWDTKTGTLQHTLKGHSKRVEAIEFSPDGQVLASISYDNTVRLWDASTGALQQMLRFYSTKVDDNLSHTNAKRVGAVKFSSKGQVLAFTSLYHALQLWVRTAT